MSFVLPDKRYVSIVMENSSNISIYHNTALLSISQQLLNDYHNCFVTFGIYVERKPLFVHTLCRQYPGKARKSQLQALDIGTSVNICTYKI